MKSKFKKLMAAALVLCLMLALLPAGVLADSETDAGDASAPEAPVNENVDPNNGDNVGPNPGAQSNGTHAITVTAPANGSIQVAQSASAGNTVTFNVTPTDGSYGVLSAKVCGTENATEVQIDSMTTGENGVVSCVFTMPEFPVTVSAVINPYKQVGISDGVIATDPSTSAIVGSTVTITPATAPEGYELSEVWWMAAEGTTGDTTKYVINPTNGAYQFTMPEYNVTVGAEFKGKPVEPPVETTFDVNVDHNYGGDAWADHDTDLEAGEWVTITVDPYDGYWLESLTVNGADVTDQVSWDWYWYYGRTGTYSFNVAGNTSVVATFATRYDDDIACIYDGRYGNVTVKVWDDARDKFVTTTSADKGDLVAVIVEPYSGYAMSDLTIRERNDWDYVSYDSSWKYDNVYYFYMPGDDVNIYVDFTEAASEHIVYVDTAKNGTLKADTTWADYGQKVYVTATPDKGYELSSLFVKTARGEQLKVYEAKKADTYYFYMPDEYVTVSAWFAPEASALPFADVSYTNWYYDAVKFVYDKGIMDGVSYYRFAPDATITRGMVVTMLWRMAGEPYESSAGFTDVASGRYYSTAVAWAAKNGIVEGMTSSTFAPDQAITREQLASILYRYARWLGFSGTGTDISGYTDAGKVSDYAYDAMCWAVKTGVVTGTSAKVLDPQGTATRAAAAQMFMNFYNYIY